MQQIIPMFLAYILQSEKTANYYCGQTNEIHQRMRRHNRGEMKSTKYGIPWALVGYMEFSTRSEAVKLEKQIKGRGIQRWLDENGWQLQTIS